MSTRRESTELLSGMNKAEKAELLQQLLTEFGDSFRESKVAPELLAALPASYVREFQCGCWSKHGASARVTPIS